MSAIRVPGRAAAAQRSAADRAWRAAVARSAAPLGPQRAVRMGFTVRPRRFVDLDSLVEVVVAGLRDAGVLAAPAPDALIAVRAEGPDEGLVLAPADPAGLATEESPGPEALRVAGPDAPRPGDRDAKRALRAALAQAWGERLPLPGPVWADVALAGPRSLMGPLEPVLDTLEPVLGRDPRGQPRQEFFPNDHVITWLRVRRTPPGDPPLLLRLGPLSPA